MGGIRYPNGMLLILKERLNRIITEPIKRLIKKILTSSFPRLTETSLPASFAARLVSLINPSGKKWKLRNHAVIKINNPKRYNPKNLIMILLWYMKFFIVFLFWVLCVSVLFHLKKYVCKIGLF